MNDERLAEIREVLRSQFGRDLAPFEVYAVELLAEVDTLRAKLAEAEERLVKQRAAFELSCNEDCPCRKRLADAEKDALRRATTIICSMCADPANFTVATKDNSDAWTHCAVSRPKANGLGDYDCEAARLHDWLSRMGDNAK